MRSLTRRTLDFHRGDNVMKKVTKRFGQALSRSDIGFELTVIYVNAKYIHNSTSNIVGDTNEMFTGSPSCNSSKEIHA